MGVVTIDPGKVVVIGAGPAGLACAARLCELGEEPTVVEAKGQVGGMAGSIDMWDHTVDFGPHRFFSSDPTVVAFWHQYIRGDFVLVSRQTRIFYRRRYFDYPLKAGNALRNLGPWKSLEAVASYLRARVFPEKDDGSLEVWISNRFGRALFTTFFKTYTEKLWGISCRRLDADWAAQRIQGLTLWKAVKSAFTGNRGNKLKTLVDEFAYPATGNQLLYDRLAQFVEESTGHGVVLDAPVLKVLTDGNRVSGVVVGDGQELPCDWLVSTMPITHLLSALPEVPEDVLAASASLRFRNTILVYLLIEETDLFSDQWLYVHEPGVLHGRVTNFRNWSPAIVGDGDTTVLCAEYWCFNEDDIWRASEESLVELASLELEQTGLIPAGRVRDGRVVRVPRCYPVYEHGYQKPLAVVTDFLDTIDGLVPIGRYGAFKYNNQDHSLLMGILAAEAIHAGDRPSLWHINTDSEYQENASADALTRSSD